MLSYLSLYHSYLLVKETSFNKEEKQWNDVDDEKKCLDIKSSDSIRFGLVLLIRFWFWFWFFNFFNFFWLHNFLCFRFGFGFRFRSFGGPECFNSLNDFGLLSTFCFLLWLVLTAINFIRFFRFSWWQEFWFLWSIDLVIYELLLKLNQPVQILIVLLCRLNLLWLSLLFFILLFLSEFFLFFHLLNKNHIIQTYLRDYYLSFFLEIFYEGF